MALDRRAITRLALPLPLEPLVFRALNAQGVDGKHERLVYAWEIAIQIAASSAWAMCRHARLRSKQLDEVMPKLARPMFGHWLELLRASRTLLATSGVSPLAPLLDGLETELDSRLERVAERIRGLPKRNVKLGGGTIGALLDALPVYRNETKGHGEPDTEFRAGSIEALAEGLLAFCELAPPTGNFRPVIVDRVIEEDGRKSVELAWMDGGQPLLDARKIDEEVRPGRPYLSSAIENAPFVPLFPIAAANRGPDGWALGWLKQQVRMPTLSFESSVGGAFASAVPDDEYAAFLRLEPETSEEGVVDESIDPWRGLLVYEEEHARVFYGRDAQSLEIVSHLEERGAAVLCGASGSGKSSLVRAGVLPKIRARQEHLLREPVVLTMVPGSSPMSALESALKDVSRGMGKHVTLFVDQLEEVATLCTDYDERTRFLDALVAFASDPNEAFLVTTVRADRIEGLLEHAGLRAMLQRSLEPIGAVGKTELRDIITLPLRGRKVPIEPALVERILNDVGEDPGALALVSQLLSVLWETRDLTIRGYEAVAGISGVLGKRADEARAAAGESVDRLLLRLARRSDDGIFTRRRVTVSELTDALSLRSDQVDALLAPFIERRLVVAGEHIEVAHEALLRSWPHLKALLERESEAIALRQEIERAAEAGELWSDATSKLKRAEELSAAGQLPLGEKERDFLRNSRRSVLRARRLARLGVGAIACLGILALGLAFWAIRASYKAKEAEREAESLSREAYASAAVALARSPHSRNKAPFPALEALAIDHRLREVPGNDRSAIIGSAYAARRYGEHFVIESTRPIRDSAQRPDGTQLALVGDEPVLRIVDTDTDTMSSTPLPEAALAVGWKTNDVLIVVTTKAIEERTDRGVKVLSRTVVNEEGLTSANVGKNGLIYTRAPGDARLWTSAGPKPVKAALVFGDEYLWWNEREEGFLGTTTPFPDASHIFVARSIGDTIVVSTRHEVEGRGRATSKRKWSFDPHETIAAVEADGTRVLVAAGKTLYAIDAGNGEATTLLKTPFVIRAITRDESRFALAGEDGRIRVWDRKTLDRIEELDGHVDEITSLTWLAGTGRIVSTSLDHTATIWRLGRSGLIRLLQDVPAGAQAPQITSGGDIAIVGGRQLRTYDGKIGTSWQHFEAPSSTLAQGGFYEQRVLGVSRDGDVFAFDAKSGAQVGESNARGAVVLARDTPLAFLCRPGECVILDGDAHVVTRFPVPSSVLAQAVAPNGKLVAFAGQDHAWTIFDVATKTPSAPITSDAPTPRAAFAGGSLVVANAKEVALHDPTGKLVAKLPGNLNDVSDEMIRTVENGRAHYFRPSGGKRGSLDVGTKLHSMAPNGRIDALFDVTDRHVQLLATDGTGEVAKLVGHTDAVTAVSWSADSRFVATTSEDRTLRLWDVHGNTNVATIELEESPAEIHLSRDATRIVTTDLSNRVVRLYDVSIDSAIELDCKVVKDTPYFHLVKDVCH